MRRQRKASDTGLAFAAQTKPPAGAGGFFGSLALEHVTAFFQVDVPLHGLTQQMRVWPPFLQASSKYLFSASR